MALRRTWTIAAVAAALCAFAPAALAQDAALPGPRTHVDPAEGTAAPAATADPDAPKLTYLKSDTTASDIGRGYLYVIARCDSRCILEVTATTKISGKQREVASISRTLRTNRMTRVRLKIRSDVRRRLAAGATFRFTAVPLPPLDR